MTCIATVKGYSDIHNWGNQPNQASNLSNWKLTGFIFFR